MNAQIIPVEGPIREAVPKNGKDFKYDELNKIVGGYIEIVYLPRNKIMVLNEEGKLLNLPINEAATLRFNQERDYIVGDVLVCDREMVE